MSIQSGAEYIDSLRGRDLAVWILGEKISETVDHPVIRPSINAVAETYDYAIENPDLAIVDNALAAGRVNRFLHVAMSKNDVVAQNKMQRELGRRTGTCFQRCVGMDAINSLFSVTFDCDVKHQTVYHKRFTSFLEKMQVENYVVGGAMTDPKGDRHLGPSQQADPDLFLRVVKRVNEGVYVRGAKMHQTGCLNSHFLLVMPTMRLIAEDSPYAFSAAIPVDAEGIKYIYGRQSGDLRACEPGVADKGNVRFSGQEAMIIFDDVFVPTESIFLDGEYEFSAPLVSRFTCYHRRSYICKAGVGDVLIGASAQIAEYNGVEKSSHIKDKVVEMVHMNETIAGTALAASYESQPTSAGNFIPNELLANICKHNVTRYPYEIARLAQDLAGGLLVTMPSSLDFENDEIRPFLEKYLVGDARFSVEDRRRILRLIENLTMGRNAVGYLTESMHGAGSPQAQRVVLQRLMGIEDKKSQARKLAGIEDR